MGERGWFSLLKELFSRCPLFYKHPIAYRDFLDSLSGRESLLMPELPEVEHVVRALARVVRGRRFVATKYDFPKLTAPPQPQSQAQTQEFRITGVSRRGKFILID